MEVNKQIARITSLEEALTRQDDTMERMTWRINDLQNARNDVQNHIQTISAEKEQAMSQVSLGNGILQKITARNCGYAKKMHCRRKQTRYMCMALRSLEIPLGRRMNKVKKEAEKRAERNMDRVARTISAEEVEIGRMKNEIESINRERERVIQRTAMMNEESKISVRKVHELRRQYSRKMMGLQLLISS